MYKILITAICRNASGVIGFKTDVVEFDSKAMAIDACDKIDKHQSHFLILHAITLFDKETPYSRP